MKAVLLAGAITLAIFSFGCQLSLSELSRFAEHRRPQQTEASTAFTPIYQKNCSGCHGADGQYGPASDLANPLYEVLIDDSTLREILAHGLKGTTMPGFAVSSGGRLSEQEIGILIQGMRQHWRKAGVSATEMPPYKAAAQGDAAHGEQVYAADCARCHGPANGAPGKAGSILNGSFLALVSDQLVRTTAIVGRPDLGMPDYRTRTRQHPITAQDVTDVVAFVVSHRRKEPAQREAATTAASK